MIVRCVNRSWKKLNNNYTKLHELRFAKALQSGQVLARLRWEIYLSQQRQDRLRDYSCTRDLKRQFHGVHLKAVLAINEYQAAGHAV